MILTGGHFEVQSLRSVRCYQTTIGTFS